MTFLASLTDLLTGAVTDQFKKLIQPSSLVAAGIFMALSVLLIEPVLVAAQFEPALAVDALPPGWQIALGTLSIFLLAYLLNSLGGAFLSVANGDALRNSLVGHALRHWQQKRFDRLVQAVEGARDLESSNAAQNLATSFPSQRSNITCTRLGNVMLAAASYVHDQYGARLDSVWPVMDVALREDKELRDRLQDDRDSLSFLVTLDAVLIIVAIEALLVSVATGELALSLAAAPLLLVAYPVYMAAVQRAETWARDVCTAFDLYLEKAGATLGLRPLAGFDTEKQRVSRWNAVSEWLSYANLPVGLGAERRRQDPSWYNPQPRADVFRVECPPTVSAWPNAAPECVCNGWVSGEQEWTFGQIADYVFTVTNNDHGPNAHVAKDSYIWVTDSRLARVKEEVDGLIVSQAAKTGRLIKGKRQNTDPPALLWPIGDVPPWSSVVLTYQVWNPEVILRAEAADPEEGASNPFLIRELDAADQFTGRMMVRIRNAGRDADLDITVMLPGAESLPRFAHFVRLNAAGQVDGDLRRVDSQLIEDGVRWRIRSVPAGGGVRLIFYRELKRGRAT